MKIGVDIRVLMDKHYSGIALYSANLLDNLLKIDKESEYYFYYNSFFNIRDKFKIWEKERVKIVSTRYPNKLYNYFFQKLLNKPKIDNFLPRDLDLFFSPHFNFTSLNNTTKHVLTIHDLSFMRYPEFFNYRKNFWHSLINLKKLTKDTKRIVAVSENTKRDIVELLNVSENKVEVIYSGINLNIKAVIKEKKERFIKKHSLKKNFILYIGNIEPRKNITGLIYAYNLLRDKNVKLVDTQLVLAGAMGWKNRAIYQARENSPYHEDIKFIGYVNQEEKEYLYEEAIYLCYPSFYEGFGFPPLEAMAKSLAVITSNVSSLPEVVGSSALLINPYDINDLATAMELLYFDNTLREDLIKKGKEQIKLFNWQKTALKYLNLFKRISNEK